MRNLFRLALAVVIGTAVAVSPITQSVSAQVVADARPVLAISNAYSAVSTDVAIQVKYIGATAPGATTTVAVAAGGDLTFNVAGAGDVSVRCPFGGTAGVIDVSDAACNTFGEVLDVINRSANWVAFPTAVLRADSSDNTLITLVASADVTKAQGLGLLRDTTIALNATIRLKTDGNVDDIQPFLTRNFVAGNPEGASASKLIGLTSNFTGTGASTITVYGISQKFGAHGTATTAPADAAALTGYVSYTEVARTAWSEAGAATTVEFTRRFFEVGGLQFNPGEAIFVRQAAATTFTAMYISAAGVKAPQRP